MALHFCNSLVNDNILSKEYISFIGVEIHTGFHLQCPWANFVSKVNELSVHKIGQNPPACKQLCPSPPNSPTIKLTKNLAMQIGFILHGAVFQITQADSTGVSLPLRIPCHQLCVKDHRSSGSPRTAPTTWQFAGTSRKMGWWTLAQQRHHPQRF